jgi:hypothetical protein
LLPLLSPDYSLPAGSRAWFWFCPEVAEPHPPLSWEMLAILAEWASRHVDDHPGLARLKGASFLNSNGVVLKKIEDDAVWAELPDATINGTIQQTAQRLTRLKPGRDFWFWMSDCAHSPAAAWRSPPRTTSARAVASSARWLSGKNL